MAIAKGSRSHILWKSESTYGVTPSPLTSWNTFPLNSDTFDENINTIQAEDIRPDRINPSLRGGNIATGGALVADFGPVRSMPFMAHLLGAIGSVTTTQITNSATPTALASSTAYTLGQIVGGSNNSRWVCSNAGSTGAGDDATDLVGAADVSLNSGDVVFSYLDGDLTASTAYTLGQVVLGANNSRWVCIKAGSTGAGDDTTDLVGTADVSLNTNAVTFRYLNGDLMASTAYKRGHVVKDASNNNWICIKGGTTHSGVLKSDLTGSLNCEITGSTSVKLIFQLIGASTVPLYKHSMLGGLAWPTPGLTLEKGIKGGDTDLFVHFLGGRVNSLELSVPQEGIVKATWNMLFSGSRQVSGVNKASSPLAVVGEAPYAGFNAFVGLNDSIGNSDRAVREFSMTVTNNAAEDAYTVGSRFRKDIPESTRRASGRLSMYFQDPQEYTWFKDETTVSLDMSLIWKGLMVAFKFPEVKLTGSGTPKISGAGIMTSDFEWTAFAETSTYDVEVVFVNASSTIVT